jgi:RsmE family RNA methyltransferase
MNLIIIRPEELSDGLVRISDPRFTHIHKYLKPEKGSRLKAGVLNGHIGTAEVMDITDSYAELRFTPEKEPPAPPKISLILALPRPKVFRRMLFSAVSIGVKDIHIINSWRVEKSYWDSPYISAESVDKVCIEALSQCKDTVMPDVTFHRFFNNFIDEALPMMPEERSRYIAHPYSENSFKPCEPAIIAIGPEGGFIEKELDTFTGRGFVPFTIGERVLTSEHFIPFVLGSVIN